MVPHENHLVAEEVAEALTILYLRWHRMVDGIMAQKGASFARARLLTRIVKMGSLRSTDLSTHFRLAPRTITEAIDGLERDGWVQRDQDPHDRRAKRIVPTEAGIVAAQSAEASRLECLTDIFNVLDAGELERMMTLMGKLSARLRALDADAE